MTKKAKVKIKVKEFVEDVLRGLTDDDLIEKYALTAPMLSRVFDQLVAAGHLSEEDLSSRNMLDSTEKVAQLFRSYVDELD